MKRETKETPEQASSDPKEQAVLLPLDQPRRVVLKVGGASVAYRFRRVLQKDWERFYAGIVNKVVQVGIVRDQIFEYESAQIELVESTLQSVDGYANTDYSFKEWKQLLPLSHKLAAGKVLRSVGGQRPHGESVELTPTLRVDLSAAWSAAGNGNMVHYTGLTHFFRHPSIEQLRRFNFETSRMRVEGTAENGITTYPSRSLVAMHIYDDLIVRVEGYSVNGSPLESVEDIKREMDGAHKAEAALALFTEGGNVSVQ